jgi:small-conductance mechanosensitive channel
MDWQQWLIDLGLPVERSPDLAAISIAISIVAGAYVLGWLVGGRAGRVVGDWWRRRAGNVADTVGATSGAVIRCALTALILLGVGSIAGLDPHALMIIAIALGIATALLAHRLSRAIGTGVAVALIIATIVLVAATAGMLGGLEPLVRGLDSVGITVGKRHFTLLATVNFVIVAAVLFVVAQLVNRLLDVSIMRMTALDISQRVLIQKLAGIGVVVAAIMLGIDLLGIDLTALAVFSGAFGLAVGFGLQKTFGNLLAGLILLMDRSIKPGDVIVVGQTFGTVSRIGVRAVSVITRDGKEHLIPNEQLMTEPVENWSYSSRDVRLHIPIGVAYGSNLALAQKLMIEAATAAARVLPEPAPRVWLRKFGESAVEHDILVWITDPESGVGNVQSDILNRLWRLFAENGIELPFPQRDLHIRSLPPGLGAAAPPAAPKDEAE